MEGHLPRLCCHQLTVAIPERIAGDRVELARLPAHAGYRCTVRELGEPGLHHEAGRDMELGLPSHGLLHSCQARKLGLEEFH